MDKQLFRDFVKFAKHQLASEDCDPMYPVLRHLNKRTNSIHKRMWLMWLYVAYYDIGSALIAYRHHSYPESLCGKCSILPTGVERRNLRGGKIYQHIQSTLELLELHPCSNRCSRCSPFKHMLQHAWGRDPELRWLIVQDNVRKIWGNGRWSGYKAQPISEPVLTQTGWLPIGELQVGDSVIGSNGKPTKVIGIYPQGKREVYRVIFNDKSFVRCDIEHLWRVKHTSHYQEKVLSTQEIMDDRWQRNSGTSWWAIPFISSPVRYKRQNKKLPIDPYVLGVLLGDGSFSKRGGARFCNIDKEIIEEVAKRLPEDCKLTKRGPIGYYISYKHGRLHSSSKPNPIVNAIRELGLAGKRAWEKHIPKQYMYSSPQNRLLLLQGLMDTDGSASQGCSPWFGTTSKTLAQQVIEIVRSLGGKAIEPRSYRYSHNKHTFYHVTFWLPKGMGAYKLTRKAKLDKTAARRNGKSRLIAKIEREGIEEECVCIKVAAADSLYVTRNFALTHNTAEILQKVADWEIIPTDMGNAFSTGPRKGLALFFDKVEGNSAEAIAKLDMQGAKLQSMLAKKGIEADIAQVETLLCDWNSVVNGHYYCGKDVDEIQESIIRAERNNSVRLKEAWEARRESLPLHYLGEYNGWVGIDKKRRSVYKDTGRVLVRKP